MTKPNSDTPITDILEMPAALLAQDLDTDKTYVRSTFARRLEKAMREAMDALKITDRLASAPELAARIILSNALKEPQ